MAKIDEENTTAKNKDDLDAKIKRTKLKNELLVKVDEAL